MLRHHKAAYFKVVFRQIVVDIFDAQLSASAVPRRQAMDQLTLTSELQHLSKVLTARENRDGDEGRGFCEDLTVSEDSEGSSSLNGHTEVLESVVNPFTAKTYQTQADGGYFWHTQLTCRCFVVRFGRTVQRK